MECRELIFQTSVKKHWFLRPKGILHLLISMSILTNCLFPCSFYGSKRCVKSWRAVHVKLKEKIYVTGYWHEFWLKILCCSIEWFFKKYNKGIIRADENIKNWMSIAMKMYDAWSISSNILIYSLHAMVHKIGFS